MDDQEDNNNVRHMEEEETGNQTKTTFGFPILDTTLNVNMKNIPLSALPTFYGKNSEDLETFLVDGRNSPSVNWKSGTGPGLSK
jgi:hypothetical protein